MEFFVLTMDFFIDVIFFQGGMVLRECSPNKGYRLACTDFINISYGSIVETRMKNFNNVNNVNTSGPSLSWRNQQGQQSKSDWSQPSSLNNPSQPSWRNQQMQQAKPDRSQDLSASSVSPCSWRIQQTQQVKTDRSQTLPLPGNTKNYALPPDPSIINCVYKTDDKKEHQPFKLLQRNTLEKKAEKSPNANSEAMKEFQKLWSNCDKAVSLNNTIFINCFFSIG